MSARLLPALPLAVAAKIDGERARLMQAVALLQCVAVAFDAGRDIEYSDGLRVITAMIEASVTALDSVELRRPPIKTSKDDD